jgi:Glycosyl transferase family 2
LQRQKVERMNPRVSIVINNFNYARFLPQSIDSALAQTLPETEVIVVDDCSTDGSADIIRAYGDRLIPVLLEKNGGQAAAMNAGVAASGGDLVIFLDADDFLYPNCAETAASALEPEVGTIQYRLNLVEACGNPIDLYPAPEIPFDHGDVVPKLLKTGRYQGTVTSGNAFARKTLLAIMPIPTEAFRISADGYLLTTAPFQGIVQCIEEPLGAYRMHGANLWMSDPSQTNRFRRSLLHDIEKYKMLREHAGRAGLVAAPEPGLNDPHHLEMRLASLCLARQDHPFSSDKRLHLAMRGALATLRARFGLRRRLLLATWFVCVGILPHSYTRNLLAWRLEPSSRPQPVQRALRRLRQLTAPAHSRSSNRSEAPRSPNA